MIRSKYMCDSLKQVNMYVKKRRTKYVVLSVRHHNSKIDILQIYKFIGYSVFVSKKGADLGV